MRQLIERPEQLDLPGMTEALSDQDRIGSVYTMSSEDVERLRKKRPKKLGIKCNRSDCDQDLHCFLPPGRAGLNAPGPCRACGANLVDWDEMSIRELQDAHKKFEVLKVEWIRHFFFHVPITPRIDEYARKRGMKGLADVAQHQLSQGKMLRFDSTWDFNQTKMLDGTIVHWARHAVACCCRKCMAYWHNVPVSSNLTASDIDYFRQLVVLYIKDRIPDLQDEPLARVPARNSHYAERKAS